MVRRSSKHHSWSGRGREPARGRPHVAASRWSSDPVARRLGANTRSLGNESRGVAVLAGRVCVGRRTRSRFPDFFLFGLGVFVQRRGAGRGARRCMRAVVCVAACYVVGLFYCRIVLLKQFYHSSSDYYVCHHGGNSGFSSPRRPTATPPQQQHNNKKPALNAMGFAGRGGISTADLQISAFAGYFD